MIMSSQSQTILPSFALHYSSLDRTWHVVLIDEPCIPILPLMLRIGQPHLEYALKRCENLTDLQRREGPTHADSPSCTEDEHTNITHASIARLRSILILVLALDSAIKI
jgi:hypothetical protein